MVAPSPLAKLIGKDGVICRPFVIPEGKFDEARLINDEAYQKKLEKGELKRNTIHPKYS